MRHRRGPDQGNPVGTLDDLVAEIRTDGGAATAHVTDVTDPDQVQQLIDSAIDEHGRIDHLINNAGLMLFSDWEDRAVDDWNLMITNTIRGYLHAISAVLPHMLDRNAGHILNMSSVAGIRVGASSGVYSATKFFIRAVTDSLRQEVGTAHNIQISTISPGVIDTGWADKVGNEQGRRTARHLDEQAISADTVAGAVLYALAQPADVTVNDVVIHPTAQTW
ncbi:SDR family oxidoreductase [Williamsia herbipolensis]|uniref:SDR family oxidoreductase n=1 Tax=Williamsia herbipolensis TaxID=1603258 RepID=A0AAU4JZ69_9NOCA|nr:SDR family oxidoreductase [Williamsia herbipolensis]